MLQSLMRMLLEINGALKISVTHNQFMVQSLMTMLFKMNNLPVDREISVGVPEPFCHCGKGQHSSIWTHRSRTAVNIARSKHTWLIRERTVL